MRMAFAPSDRISQKLGFYLRPLFVPVALDQLTILIVVVMEAPGNMGLSGIDQYEPAFVVGHLDRAQSSGDRNGRAESGQHDGNCGRTPTERSDLAWKGYVDSNSERGSLGGRRGELPTISLRLLRRG